MTTDAWITAAFLVVMIVVLVTERLPPLMVIAGTVIGLMVTGVLDDNAAFAGFSDSAVITIASLYVLAGSIDITGALEGFTRRTFTEDPRVGERRALARFLVPTTVLSGVVANTPLVSVLIPRVLAWCRRTGRSPSKYLMPLSYAAVLGGVITLIGTSTNLVVASLLEQQGREKLHVFDLTPVGLPVAVIGTILLVLGAGKLVPARLQPLDTTTSQTREFTVDMVVLPGGGLDGHSVRDAGLRTLDGVFLAAIQRDDGEAIRDVGPDTVLRGDDRLIFVGDISRIMDLQAQPGLRLAPDHHASALASDPQRKLFEVVVSPISPLVGATLPELDFRGTYGAVVIAVHRSGERLVTKPGDVRFRPGDVLVLLAPSDWAGRWRSRHDFLVIAGTDASPPKRRSRARFVELVALALLVLSGTELVSLQEAAVVAATLLIGTGTITLTEAKRSVQFDIIAMMALSVALGAAANSSGLATVLAGHIVDGLGSFGDVGLLAGILIATMIVTELLSNNAAAALMLPIALGVVDQTGLSERAFVMAVIIGASCSFITPLGYQTNTMVYGLGGYKYTDFTRLGAPLTAMVIVISVITIPLVIGL
ncbi:MAG: SLC13 family permease [Ilumatobacteraceae bacterium]